MYQIRLLIMCEPQGVSRGLAAIFTSIEGFKIMGEVGCGLDSIAEAQKIQPDVIIIEINSEDEIGELLLPIKESCPYTKVLVLIKDDTVSEARAAIDAGADGCLSKTMLPCDLVKAVELTCRAGVLCLPCSFKHQLSSQEKMSKHRNGPAAAGNINPDASASRSELNLFSTSAGFWETR
ncbi:MAG: response regulator [Desulfotomaculaceae bacterium]|nr:response regulator [Desulfotomaculaceae bacterium]